MKLLARKLERDYDEYYNAQYSHPDKLADYAEPAVRPVPLCNTALRRRVALTVVMILLFAFYMVMRSDLFIQNGYELTKLRQKELELVKNIDYMQVNLAKARSPERIIARAEQLDMVMAESNFYVRAASGKE